MQYPTPHIHATPADFAQTVLMPGDPLRAQYIAQTYLEDAVLVNNVRGIQGYTGTYRGVRLSVMASGMGMPSMGIYSHELFCCFGVKNIIRIGSAGALQGQIQLRDLVIAQGASTDANWGNQFHTPGNLAPLADFTLLETCVSAARDLGANAHVGNVLSSQYFYTDEEDMPQALQANTAWQRMGILANHGLGENGGSGRRNGSGGALSQCLPLRRTRVGPMHHFRSHFERHFSQRPRAANLVSADDGGCTGNGHSSGRATPMKRIFLMVLYSIGIDALAAPMPTLPAPRISTSSPGCTGTSSLPIWPAVCR